MPISNYARERVALLIGGSANTPDVGSGYLAVGSGSGALSVNTTGLLSHFDRNLFTGGSVDLATVQEIGMTADFNNAELSGLALGQFGVFVESSGGQAWQVENTFPITFNGTNELQVEIRWQVF